MKTKITLLLASCALFFFISANAQLTVLSGPALGSYSVFISDIEKVLSTDSTKLIVNMDTDGAAYNLEKIADRNTPYKMALIQSDLLFHMSGLDKLNNTEMTKNIKVVLPLANEEIHLVTISDSPLEKMEDLTEKMIGIGTQYQGTYYTSVLIKNRSKILWNSRIMSFEDALRDLNTKKIDAFFVVGSAPLEKLNIDPRAFSRTLKLIPLVDFNDWAKYYKNDTIYAGDYKWLEKNIPTFSVKTILVVNESKLTEKDRKDIAIIVEGIKANLETLKANGHPKWKEVDLSDWSSSDWPYLE